MGFRTEFRHAQNSDSSNMRICAEFLMDDILLYFPGLYDYECNKTGAVDYGGCDYGECEYGGCINVRVWPIG